MRGAEIMPCDMMKDWTPELQRELDEAIERGDKPITLTGKYKTMPCYDSRNDPDGEYQRHQREQRAKEHAEFEEKYGTTDPAKLRDMLCWAIKRLNKIGDDLDLIVVMPEDIANWYVKHLQWDKDTSK